MAENDTFFTKKSILSNIIGISLHVHVILYTTNYTEQCFMVREALVINFDQYLKNDQFSKFSTTVPNFDGQFLPCCRVTRSLPNFFFHLTYHIKEI